MFDKIHHMAQKTAYLPAVILLVAAALRMLGMANQPLSDVEQTQIQTSMMPVTEVLSHDDMQPPLYPLVVKSWCGLFPALTSPRVLSLLFGLMTLVVIYALACEAAGNDVAIFAMFVASVSPLHVYYSQEGHCRSLAILLSSLLIWTALRISHLRVSHQKTSDSPNSLLAAFVAVAVIGCYTDYFFCLLVMATVTGVMVAQPQRTRQMMAASVAIIIACIPLGMLLPGDFETENVTLSQTNGLVETGYSLFSFESGFSLGPSPAQVQTMETVEVFEASLPWIILLGLISILLLLLGSISATVKGDHRFWFFSSVATLLLSIGLCLLLGIPMQHRLAICWIPYIIFIAFGLKTLLLRPRIVMLLILLTCYSTALYNRQFVDQYRNSNVPSVTQRIEQPNELIVPLEGAAASTAQTSAQTSPQTAASSSRQTVPR